MSFITFFFVRNILYVWKNLQQLLMLLNIIKVKFSYKNYSYYILMLDNKMLNEISEKVSFSLKSLIINYNNKFSKNNKKLKILLRNYLNYTQIKN